MALSDNSLLETMVKSISACSTLFLPNNFNSFATYRMMAVVCEIFFPQDVVRTGKKANGHSSAKKSINRLVV